MLPELVYSWGIRPWLGMGGPPGLPQPIAARWTGALLEGMTAPVFLQAMRSVAIVPTPMRPAELRTLMAESYVEHERIARAIRIGRFSGG